MLLTSTRASINVPRIRINPLSFPKLSNRVLMEELSLKEDCIIPTITSVNNSDPLEVSKLYSILEIVADRVEMHKNIGIQRDNWNCLLLTSVNTIIFTAATMSGLSGISPVLKVSSTILYLAATGILVLMNSIQPSQLAEEQRNATRLFKQLHDHIWTILSVGDPDINDENESIEKILAIDRAYPLPLLGAMLEKFPPNVEPAVWWPEKSQMTDGNGLNGEFGDKMRQISEVLKRKDEADYLKLGEQALKLNKILAISGPVLTCFGALGSALAGSNPLAVVMGVVSGALASIVSSMEHGGQVGMVFEMYRSNAGFFKLMEETIESNVQGNDNGELLEIKVALQLGRSLSELKNLATSTRNDIDNEEFASKLF